MKKNGFRILVCVLGLLFVSTLMSCFQPSPLYGEWKDNSASSLKFNEDGTFEARINSKSGLKDYQGTYDIFQNVLVFTVAEPEIFPVVSEWDIRGAMLFINWKNSDGENIALTLYHTSK